MADYKKGGAIDKKAKKKSQMSAVMDKIKSGLGVADREAKRFTSQVIHGGTKAYFPEAGEKEPKPFGRETVDAIKGKK